MFVTELGFIHRNTSHNNKSYKKNVLGTDGVS